MGNFSSTRSWFTHTAGAPQVVASINGRVAACLVSNLFFARLRAVSRNCDGEIDRAALPCSPRSHMEDILAFTPPEALDAMLAGTPAAVLAGGHTQIQMLRQHHGPLLVNPGSVGLAFKDYVGGRAPAILSHAEYALIEEFGGVIGVSLRRLALDKGKPPGSGRHRTSIRPMAERAVCVSGEH
jgi:hypothetical protein